MAIVSFHQKSEFFDDFLLISFFSSNNIQKTLNIATIYFFSEKIINDVFFNVFRSINGILNKTFFYKYNICNLNKEEKFCLKSYFFKVFFIFSFVGGSKPKKYFFFSRQYIFCLKLKKIPIFMLFSYFLRQYIYFFSKTA